MSQVVNTEMGNTRILQYSVETIPKPKLTGCVSKRLAILILAFRVSNRRRLLSSSYGMSSTQDAITDTKTCLSSSRKDGNGNYDELQAGESL